VNQLAAFKVIDGDNKGNFTIPQGEISGRNDLMYYFEVLNDDNHGWFQPDPFRETPYYVLRVIPGS
jgi:hypothetical protein